MSGSGGGEDAADMMMSGEEDLNISGQFSPPHEPEEPSGFAAGSGGVGVGKHLGVDSVGEGQFHHASAAVAEIDSPYSMMDHV